jgi:hypothetical protein
MLPQVLLYRLLFLPKDATTWDCFRFCRGPLDSHGLVGLSFLSLANLEREKTNGQQY